MEDQKLYDTVVLAAHRNIFGEKDDPTRFQMVVQRLGAGENLAENVGGIAGATIGRIKSTAEAQQREIPTELILEAADEIVDQVLNIAEASGKVEDREKVKKKALFEAMRVVGQAELKGMTPEKKAKAEADLGKFKGNRAPIESDRAKSENAGLIAERRV